MINYSRLISLLMDNDFLELGIEPGDHDYRSEDDYSTLSEDILLQMAYMADIHPSQYTSR